MAHGTTRARACTPSSTTSTRGGAYLRADIRKSPASIIWDTTGCGSIYDIRRVIDGATITLCSNAWTWRTRATRCERRHMAYGAVWLRVRTLSVLLWRWERTTCRGLADWWNLIVRLIKAGSRIGIRTFRACQDWYITTPIHIHTRHRHRHRHILTHILLHTRHISQRRPWQEARARGPYNDTDWERCSIPLSSFCVL